MKTKDKVHAEKWYILKEKFTICLRKWHEPHLATTQIKEVSELRLRWDGIMRWNIYEMELNIWDGIKIHNTQFELDSEKYL